jgi:HEAT repeat protein
VTPADLVHELFAAAGTREFPLLLAQVETSGEDVAEALFALVGDDRDYPPAAPGAHPRQVWDDWAAVSIAAARRWPDRFMAFLDDHPELPPDSVPVLQALGWIDRPDARDLLVGVVQRRAAGNQYKRECALEGLARLADPRLPGLLLRLIKDRSPDVRNLAVSAAIENGDARLLPALRRVAPAERTYPGVRNAAYDAIEAIVTRENLTDEPLGPRGRQLIEIRRPEGKNVVVEAVLVHKSQEVTVDTELARLRVDAEPLTVKAPHGGLVVTVGVARGWPPKPIMFRLRSWMIQ